MNRHEARALVDDWVQRELTGYADTKRWPEREADDAKLLVDGLAAGSFWRDYIDQYLHRSAVLGLDTAVGRQALLKGLVTLHEAAVAMAMAYPLPEPGRPSGDL